MTLKELKEKLIRDGYPSHSYSLDGSDTYYADNGFILNHKAGEWTIEFIERGVRHEDSRWTNEIDACDEFLRTMEKYVKPSIKSQKK